jgi:hypothetical protein
MSFRVGYTGAKPRRRGITIIETMVLITAVSTALGLCAVTIRVLLRLKTDGQSRLAAQVGLERLARQLRNDVHAAADAQVVAPSRDGKASGLHLSLEPKHGVAYETRRSAVMRVESLDGNVTHREVYSLPAARDVEFEIRPEAGRQFVALVIRKRSGSSGTGSGRPLEAVALLGKHNVEAVAKRRGPRP